MSPSDPESSNTRHSFLFLFSFASAAIAMTYLKPSNLGRPSTAVTEFFFLAADISHSAVFIGLDDFNRQGFDTSVK